MNKNRVKFGIGSKFSISLLIFGAVLSISLLVLGICNYDNSIKQYYNDTAYQIAGMVRDFYTDEELLKYADLTTRYNNGEDVSNELNEVINSDSYKNKLSLIETLRKNVGANDINICVLDEDVLKNFNQSDYDNYLWNPLYYIVDCYCDNEQSFVLGDSGAILAEYRERTLNSIQTGQPSKEFYISSGSFGYNITAVSPVTIDNQTAVFVVVEIPMSTLQENIRSYILQVVIIVIIFSIVAIVLFRMYLIKLIIKPVELVANEAEKFTENNNLISEKLSKIKSNDEIQLLSESILKMEHGINEYIDNIKRITGEKERIVAELNIATQIQADMLPSIFPAFPNRYEFDIYATMNAAKEVGGDFYDFFLVDDDHLALVMADVSGKGVPAALFMVIAKTLIKNRTMVGGTPAEIFEYVNNQLCDGNKAEMFVTTWLAIIEISTGKCVASNAGHEYPAICRAGGTFELYKQKHSPALATMENMRFKQYEFEIHSGDRIFVYTDGVAEATNVNDELFGTDRMLDALNKDLNATPEHLLEIVKQEIDAFVGDAPQFDDITMLCLNYYGKDGIC